MEDLALLRAMLAAPLLAGIASDAHGRFFKSEPTLVLYTFEKATHTSCCDADPHLCRRQAIAAKYAMLMVAFSKL